MSTFSKSKEEFIAKQSFLIFFGFGLFLICLSKYWDNQILASFFAVSVLIIYAIILHKYQSYIREDQAGDNLYYMGFLFTLISLAWALYEFGSTEHATEGIISNFAIALSSTLVGLALRVFFNQMRVDPYEVERTSRLQLSDAVQRLNSHLNDSVTTFEQFSNGIKKELRDALQETAQKATDSIEECSINFNRHLKDSIVTFEQFSNDIMEELKKTVQETTSQTVGSIKDCSSQFVKTSDLVNKTISDAASKMNATAVTVVSKIDEELVLYASNAEKLSTLSSEYADTISGSIAKIEKLKSPEDVIIAKIEPALNVIAEYTENLTKKSKLETDRHTAMINSIISVTSGIDQLAKTVNEASQTSDSFTNNLKSFNALADETKKIQKSFEEFINRSNAAHSSFVSTQSESFQSVNDTIARYNQIIEKTNEAAQLYSKQIESFTSKLETASERIESTVASIEKKSSDFSQKAADSLNQAVLATTKVHDSLAHMSEHLVKTLK